MKRLIPILLTVSALPCSLLHAQNTTGKASAAAAATAKNNNWQNWAFAASAMVTAAIGVFVVTIHDGNQPSSTSH